MIENLGVGIDISSISDFKKIPFDTKSGFYKKIFQARKSDSIISSNTSTIPLKVLSEKMSAEDKKDFCITHFFNPVRYMGLLEIVSEKTPKTWSKKLF